MTVARVTRLAILMAALIGCGNASSVDELGSSARATASAEPEVIDAPTQDRSELYAGGDPKICGFALPEEDVGWCIPLKWYPDVEAGEPSPSAKHRYPCSSLYPGSPWPMPDWCLPE